jgi:hypothetical protein
MHESPRTRRLRSDQRQMQQLKADSTIVDFVVPGAGHRDTPEVYEVYFRGRGLWKAEETNEVRLATRHHITIQLGAGYPRMMPELKWRSPIFHPNISAAGVVCLGGYSTHWVPSLQLDELCGMLWDMIRYENFDIDSPYNREAAQWVRTQSSYGLPVDPRPLRDRRAAAGRWSRDVEDRQTKPGSPRVPAAGPLREPAIPKAEIVFMDAEIVDAEIVGDHEPGGDATEILYIE